MSKERDGDSASERQEWLWFLLVPAFIMSLGWGLRGYIGGGPLGAMIPGVFVTLALCLKLGRRPATAAVLAAMGSVAISFGGTMTYGQTIGLVRSDDTLAWGWLGLTLKGAVWGLLGGAVLGLGLVVHRMTVRQVVSALVALLLAAIVGMAVINEPKLIYFSDPVNKPRDESWAGLLFGALALLAWMSVKNPGLASIPRRFAAFGAVGGGIGFGGGASWIIYGTRLGKEFSWVPWWKYMEFTFGLCFGAALGLCAHALRKELRRDAPAMSDAETPSSTPYLMGSLGVLLVMAALFLWPLFGLAVERGTQGGPASWILTPAARVLLGSTGLGCALILLALRFQMCAWHVAVTIPLVASVIDLQRDWLGEAGFDVHPAIRWGLVVVAGLATVAALAHWQERPDRTLRGLLLALVFAFMAVGTAKGISNPDLLTPAQERLQAAGSYFAHLRSTMTGEVIVHAIFWLTTLLSTVGILRVRAH